MWSSPAPGPIRSLSPELSRISPITNPPPVASSSSSTTPGQLSAASAPEPSLPHPFPSQDGHTPADADSGDNDNRLVFIAVHAGAGFLHPIHHPAICTLLQSACNTALKQAGSVEEAVTIAISVLEASPLTNAGEGSCLTEEGVVEAEACIALGNGSYGSVGAVTGVDHPIQAAYRLCNERNQLGLIKELSRVRPISLVGQGAYEYAASSGLGVAPSADFPAHHVTDQTRATWQRYKDMIAKHARKHRLTQGDSLHGAADKDHMEDDGGREERRKRMRAQGEFQLNPDPRPYAGPPGVVPEPQGDSPASTPDTVGAVACDALGRVCAGSSSGGIWMKHKGRLGSSFTPGAGCYAANYDDKEKEEREEGEQCSVAASVSGCGESIMEQLVALRCCEQMQQRDGADASMKDVMKSLMMRRQVSSRHFSRTKKRRKNSLGTQDTLDDDDGLSTGIIGLRVLPTGPLDLQFCWAHTAQHFAVGYAVDSEGSGKSYEGEAWVSVLDGEATQKGGMKMGELDRSLHIDNTHRPPAAATGHAAADKDAH